MAGADPDALWSASAALNEVLRLEQVRFDWSVEDWEEELAGLIAVAGSAARLADCIGDHLNESGGELTWRDGKGPASEDPGRLTKSAVTSVREAGDQLASAAETLARAKEQLASLARRSRRSPAEPPV